MSSQEVSQDFINLKRSLKEALRLIQDQLEERAFRQQWLKESQSSTSEEAKNLNCEICVVYPSRTRAA